MPELIKKGCFFIGTAALLFACAATLDKKGGVEQYSPRLGKIKQAERGYLFFNKGNSFSPDYDTIPILYKLIDSLAIYQGDIILGSAEMLRLTREKFFKGVGIKSLSTDLSERLWPSGKVFFRVDISVTRWRATILEAIAEWESNTDLKFTEIQQGQGDYIDFVRGEGYASSIGRQGGRQTLYIDADPEKGKIMHEIGHAVGLWHEHSRKDRDNFITVFRENIEENHTLDFDIQCCDVNTQNTQYDYGSLMHYPKDAFAKTGNTIEPKQRVEIGQRERLSETDKAGIKNLYK